MKLNVTQGHRIHQRNFHSVTGVLCSQKLHNETTKYLPDRSVRAETILAHPLHIVHTTVQ